MMQVLSVASEAYPLVKTGGLGDVVGALPGALSGHGIMVTTLLPGYPAVRAHIGEAPLVHHYPNLMGAEARLLASHINGFPLLVLDAPALFQRDGGPYGDRSGTDWPDNWRRFAALGTRRRRPRFRRESPTGSFDCCTPMIGMLDWRRPISYAPGPGRGAPSLMTIHQHRFQAGSTVSIFPFLGLPRVPTPSTAWNITAAWAVSSKAGLAAHRPLPPSVPAMPVRFANRPSAWD
jgi:starch synthase